MYNGSAGGVFDLNHESEESDEERKDEEKEVEEEEPNMNAGNLEDESDLSTSKQNEEINKQTGTGGVDNDSDRMVELKHAMEIERYKQRTKDIEDGIVPELAEWQKMAVGRKWCSNLFHAVKYLNNATFAENHPGKILEKALAKVGMDTDGRKRGGAEAVKRYLKMRVGSMRDYYMTQTKESVVTARKLLFWNWHDINQNKNYMSNCCCF